MPPLDGPGCCEDHSFPLWPWRSRGMSGVWDRELAERRGPGREGQMALMRER